MQVTRLQPRDCARLDGGVVRDLLRDLGAATAEEIVYAALEDLLRHTARMEEAWQACDFAALIGRVAEVADTAERIGLRGVARVAGDVAICAGQGDDIALAATLSRLMRQVRTACDQIAVMGPSA